MPTDEQIVQYEAQIKEAESDQVPLIGPFEPGFESLERDYADGSPLFMSHIRSLAERFKGWRRTRGDGNCFFRAFVFSYFYQIVCYLGSLSRVESGSGQARQLVAAITDIHARARARFAASGFESLATEDFVACFDNLLSILARTAEPEDLALNLDILYETMNTAEPSHSLVVYFRLLASAYLRTHAAQYEPFLEEGSTQGHSMESYCAHVVEAFGRESDDLCITAIVQALEMPVTIVAIDASHAMPQSYRFVPETSRVAHLELCLLYRPGHYDILHTESP